MKLLTSAEMRELESRAEAAGVSTETLMENAGLAVAQEIWMQLGSLEDRRIAVLVGNRQQRRRRTGRGAGTWRSGARRCGSTPARTR